MRVRLATLDRARREFIANASHELRTPLFSLGGFLELLADEELDEATRQDFLETMREQVDRLAKLATDLLDLSRLDAGRMRVEHEPVDLGARSRELVAEEFAAVAERKDHRARASPSSGRPIARADEPRVLQIGRVARRERARAHAGGDEGDAAGVRATAARRTLGSTTTGPGIPAEHAQHVFDRFYRGGGRRRLGQRARARDRAGARAAAWAATIELDPSPGDIVRVALGAAPTSVAAAPCASAFPRENARRVP